MNLQNHDSTLQNLNWAPQYKTMPLGLIIIGKHEALIPKPYTLLYITLQPFIIYKYKEFPPHVHMCHIRNSTLQPQRHYGMFSSSALSQSSSLSLASMANMSASMPTGAYARGYVTALYILNHGNYAHLPCQTQPQIHHPSRPDAQIGHLDPVASHDLHTWVTTCT